MRRRCARIEKALNPKAKEKCAAVAKKYLTAQSGRQAATSPEPIARREVRIAFPGVSAKQEDLLVFYLLANVAAQLLPFEAANREKMSEMSSLRLQMTMDRRAKIIKTLSSVMKKISTTQDTLVQNMK
jgi:hypothetical protein